MNGPSSPPTIPIAVRVNGTEHQLTVETTLTLLELLRGELGLTGAKLSCGEQRCGACTVLVDGAPVSACVLLAYEADGAEVLTIEGLADSDTLDPVQQAFVDAGAVQCGFCTPGMIMTVRALFNDIPEPEDGTVRSALVGNLCRCTGYGAILRASSRMRGGSVRASGPAAASGQPEPRADVLAKVTGRAQFTADLRQPGMLHACVVRSDRPHAQILGVHTSLARQAPGVVAVVTADDLDGLDAWFGHAVLDRPVLASEVVRFAGEPVALVIADTPQRARRAADTVHVSYDNLPPVLDPSTAGDGPPLHPAPRRPGGISALKVEADLPRNLCHRAHRERGDVERELAHADLMLEDTYRFPGVYQYALEPHTSLASWDDGALTVWSSAQHPYAVRRELARIFGLDLVAVRVVAPYIGGGFGSKSWTKVEPLAAVAAWKVGRPVRLKLDLPGAMHTSRRHGATVTVTTGFANDGRILARQVEALYDTGAYTDNGPQVVESALDSTVAPYDIPAYRVEARAVFTNTVPAGSMRAIGGPQMSWACESQLDVAARRLGLDPVALRRRNLAERGAAVFPGLTPVDADLHASLGALDAHRGQPPADSGTRDRQPAGCGAGQVACGRGAALAMTGAGASPVTTAWVRLHADGSVTVHAGSSEMGQGSGNALMLVAARALGVPPQRVTLVAGDSRSAPYDQSTGASRTTTVTGSAVLAAAHDVLAQLRAIAAEHAGVAEDEVTLAHGVARWHDGSATYAELVAAWFGPGAGELLGRGYSGRRVGALSGSTPLFWEVAMGAAEVSIDLETGVVAVDRYVGVSDVGTAIHPPSVKGQEEGAVLMGMGHTLWEALHYEDGQVRNATLAGYRVPTTVDVPAELVTVQIANGDGPGPFGARGIGEAAVVPVGAAIGNAVRDATGVDPHELPLTPERVWRLLRDAGLAPSPPPRRRSGRRRKG